jgi:hypothetical protein
VATKAPDKTKPADKATDTTPDAEAAKKKAPHEPVAIHGPDSVIDRLYPHIKKIAWGAVALFVVIGGYVGWRWMKNRHAAKDTTKLSAALLIANAKIVEPGQTPPPVDPKAPPSTDPTYPSAKDRATAAAAALADAGRIADKNALYRASLLMDAGKLDDAAAVYKDHVGDAGVDGELAREGLGYVAEAKAAASKDPAEQQKLYEQALDAYKAAQPDEQGPRRDYALYDQARMLSQLNKRAEAKAALDAALKFAPKSQIKSDIEARLALLEGP